MSEYIVRDVRIEDAERLVEIYSYYLFHIQGTDTSLWYALFFPQIRLPKELRTRMKPLYLKHNMNRFQPVVRRLQSEHL